MKKPLALSALALAISILFSSAAHADDYVITIKDHKFSPEQLTIPTGQKIKLTIKNLDSTAAEFESSDLNREKVVSGNSEIVVYVGPLNAGSYNYFDDFHRATTKGSIIAK